MVIFTDMVIIEVVKDEQFLIHFEPHSIELLQIAVVTR